MWPWACADGQCLLLIATADILLTIAGRACASSAPDSSSAFGRWVLCLSVAIAAISLGSTVHVMLTSTDIVADIFYAWSILLLLLLLSTGVSFGTTEGKWLRFSLLIIHVLCLGAALTMGVRCSEFIAHGSADTLIVLSSTVVLPALDACRLFSAWCGTESNASREQHAAMRSLQIPLINAAKRSSGSDRDSFASASTEAAWPGAGVSAWRQLSLFTWLTPLFKKGRAGIQISYEDLPPLPVKLCSAVVHAGFAPRLVSSTGHSAGGLGWSLQYHLMKEFGGQWVVLGLLRCVTVGLSFLGPLLLNNLLQYIESGDTAAGASVWNDERWRGTSLWVAMVGATLAAAVVNSQSGMLTSWLQVRMRAAVVPAVLQRLVAGTQRCPWWVGLQCGMTLAELYLRTHSLVYAALVHLHRLTLVVSCFSVNLRQ